MTKPPHLSLWRCINRQSFLFSFEDFVLAYGVLWPNLPTALPLQVLPTPPPLFPLHLMYFVLKPTEFIYCHLPGHGGRTIYWHMDSFSGIAPLKKRGDSSASSWQFPVRYLAMGRTHEPFPLSCCDFGWFGPKQTAIACVPCSCYAQQILFLCSDSLPLALRVFLPLLPRWSLSPGGGRGVDIDVSFIAKLFTVSSSLYVDQPWDSVFVTIYCRQKAASLVRTRRCPYLKI